MKCPSCPEITLLMMDRQGVEIDYCPACRGIWLDRGELDKLLDRAGAASAVSAPATAVAQGQPRSRDHSDFEDSDYREKQRHQRGYKKSWLSEIFD